MTAVAAIGIGATLGALLRWWLGLRLNALVPAMPMGTLAANLVGGFLVGVAIALFERHPGIAPGGHSWRGCLFPCVGWRRFGPGVDEL